MDDQMPARERNRLNRRRRKNGQIGPSMIGGSAKHTFLVGQQIIERAEQVVSNPIAPKPKKRSRKKHSKSGCAIFSCIQ